MRTKLPDYYKDFKCIASECKDSCCAGWEVDVDEQAAKYYESVDGEFGNRLKASMIRDEDGVRFELKENRRCCFLNECNLCDLYTALGEEHLCDTCTDFPRFLEEFGDIKEKGISLSCPTAAKLILDHPSKLEFEEVEEDEMISLNDIDYDLYIQLMTSRKIAMEIVQNRNLEINDRIALVLIMSNEIQKKIFKEKYKKIAKVNAEFADEKKVLKILSKTKKKANKHVDGKENTKRMLGAYEEFEIINDIWPDKLSMAVNVTDNTSKADYETYLKNREIQYEQLMMYFVYRYFMKAVYDYDLTAKVKLGVSGILVIRAIEKAEWIANKVFSLEDFIWLCHLYSKEVEHSDENMEAIENLSHDSMDFHLEALIASLYEVEV